jgi:hypothetical protein
MPVSVESGTHCTIIYGATLFGKSINKHWLSLFCFSLKYVSNSAFYFTGRLVLGSLTSWVLHEKLTVAHLPKESSSHGTPNSLPRSLRSATAHSVHCTDTVHTCTLGNADTFRLCLPPRLCELLRVCYELRKCNWLNIHWRGNYVNRFEEKTKHAFVMASPRGHYGQQQAATSRIISALTSRHKKTENTEKTVCTGGWSVTNFRKHSDSNQRAGKQNELAVL